MISYVGIDKIAQVLKILFVMINLKTKFDGIFLFNLYRSCQHGFRSQRSCETQLVQFFHDMVSNLGRALNRGHRQTDVIIMDFAKISHESQYTRYMSYTDALKNSFFPRTIPLWNSLPSSVVASKTTDEFKALI